MNNQPLDKGRLVAVVDTYTSKTEQNPDGSFKIKPKYMAIGEATRWQNEQGGHYDVITQYLNPPTLPCKTRIFWDSESQQQGQAPAPQQQAPAPQYQQPQYQQR